MNAAIAICAMLVGGIVLPDVDDTTPALKEDLSQPGTAQQREMRNAGQQSPAAPSLTTESAPPAAQGASQLPMLPEQRQRFNQFGKRLSTMPPSIPGTPTDPMASSALPAEPISAGGMQGQMRGAASLGGRQPTMGGGERVAPTAGGGSYGSGNAGYSSPATQPQAQFAPMTSSPAVTGAKPFTDTQTSSPMSPYLNMYTARTNNGTISPYYSGVLPAMDQGQANQKFSAQIGGLQNSLSRQGMQLNRLYNQDVPMGAGLANPSQFLNYRQYYPNAAQGTAPGMGP